MNDVQFVLGQGVELAEAIFELAEDPERRARLGQLGRERASAFTWDESARRVLDIYQRLATR